MFMRQLNYLIALDTHRHFGRAAESCHVSQPALSNGIRELEQELGITIVKRSRTFQGITPEGERVISWAREMLHSLHGLREEADLMRTIPKGHLTMGGIPTAIHAATLLCAEYRQSIPQLTLEILSLSTPAILKRLKEQELDLALLYDRSVMDETFDVLPLYAERFVLIASAQTSLPRELNWAEVAALPLCLLGQDMQNRQTLDNIFKTFESTAHVVLETNSIDILLTEALSGRSYTVLPLSALPTQYARAGLRIHPITPERTEDICLVRLRRDNQSALSKAAWRLAADLDIQVVLDELLLPGL